MYSRSIQEEDGDGGEYVNKRDLSDQNEDYRLKSFISSFFSVSFQHGSGAPNELTEIYFQKREILSFVVQLVRLS